MIESARRNGTARVNVGLCGRLKALAAGVQGLHVGEHGENGAPAPVDLSDDEDVPEWSAVVPYLAPADAAPQVRRRGVVNVLRW